MQIFAFQTDRLYTEKGQRIAAAELTNGDLLFTDIDRGIEFGVERAKLGDDFTFSPASALFVYDYQSKDWHCGMPFRHPEVMQTLRQVARDLPGPKDRRLR